MPQLDDPSTKKPAVNLPELLTRVENDRELLRELVGIFKKQFPLLLGSLREAVARGDMKGVEVTSHTLKGTLSNLGATRAAAKAGQLERLGREQEQADLKDTLTVFEAEVAGLLPELDAYTTESQG